MSELDLLAAVEEKQANMSYAFPLEKSLRSMAV